MSAPEDAGRLAAARFFEVLKLVAGDEALTPEVMLHFVGLTGALLIHHSPYPRTDILTVIESVASDPSAVAALHLSLRVLGLEPDPPPSPPRAA